ncbi:MAG: DUF6285 domain-containing protein [Anaerolineae bacterium]|nr:DUF6285 domain-containing protein [Anaerolineae bacterium]
MQDRPTASELLEAVQAHLAENVVPALAEPQLRFRTLVAANVLGIVTRELALTGVQIPDEWQRLAVLLQRDVSLPATHAEQVDRIREMRAQLCQAIASGAYDEGEGWEQLLQHCLRTAEEKLAISNPGFLARCQAEGAP